MPATPPSSRNCKPHLANLVSWCGSMATWRAPAVPFARRPSQMNSAEIPYPRPTSIVRAARSRTTQFRSASPSEGLAATGKRECTVPSERATALLSYGRAARVLCRRNRDRFSVGRTRRRADARLVSRRAGCARRVRGRAAAVSARGVRRSRDAARRADSRRVSRLRRPRRIVGRAVQALRRFR